MHRSPQLKPISESSICQYMVIIGLNILNGIIIIAFISPCLQIANRIVALLGFLLGLILIHKQKWMLLSILFFTIGYCVTFNQFENSVFPFMICTLFSAVFVCILIRSLSKNTLLEVPIWVTLFVFITAYYLKFYWVSASSILSPHWHSTVAQFSSSEFTMIKTYKTLTYAFVTFCLTSVILLKNNHSTLEGVINKERLELLNLDKVMAFLLPVVICLIIFACTISYYTGITVMGSESIVLPFRLSGWLFYVRLIAIPAFLLTCLWCSILGNSTKGYIMCLLVLIVFSFIEMVLRASRGTIIICGIEIICLLFLMGKFSKKTVWLVVLIGLLGVLSWPVFTEFRYLFDPHSGSRFASLFYSVIKVYETDQSFFAIISDALNQLFTRFSGIEKLIPIIGLDYQLGFEALSTPRFMGGIGLNKIFTWDVLCYNVSAYTSSGPSFLGWFYLYFGNLTVICGVFTFTVFIFFIWKTILVSNLTCKAIVLSILVFDVILWTTAGAFDNSHLLILSLLATTMMVEFIIRLIGSEKN